jgi:hypothetical protein
MNMFMVNCLYKIQIADSLKQSLNSVFLNINSFLNSMDRWLEGQTNFEEFSFNEFNEFNFK